MSTQKKLFFSVGEPSGDLHAANLMERLSRLVAPLDVRGFGGPHMQRAGCQLDYLLTELAVVGFVEVLPKLREFFRVADQASEVFATERPDGVVLVDFPGFNWHIAKRAKQHNIPVFYYLPPQLWAWGSWRLKKMQKYVDHILCNLPFEQQWYAERGVDATYVGHPFFDEVDDRQLDRSWLASWADHEGCQVAVLPGSRTREVRNIWPMQFEVIQELSSRYPKTRFLVACLRESHRDQCQQWIKNKQLHSNIHFFVGKTSEIIEAADCSLMKSGSVSLEMMARGTPSVVVYHASNALYCIGKCLSNVDSMTLPNLIAGKTVMPEFLAVGTATSSVVEKAIAAMDRLIGDPDERARQRLELAQLRRKFGQSGASEKAASYIANKLGTSHQSTYSRAA